MNATHPTKEQVRAYLLQRGRAHLPPPPPDEIRRRLDWRVEHEPAAGALPAAIFLPSALFQLGALMALTWICLPFGPRDPR
ncbi:hypothetical protein [Pseudoduganella sp. RAF53_2]|uniref:hypothetical protein n=1 Tax=unclassified Pseudoduganella TaxID=2637179 RepID=UPI003F9ACEA7